MDEIVLGRYFQLRKPSLQRMFIQLPLRLFKNLKQHTRNTYTLSHEEDFPPVPFIKALLRMSSNNIMLNSMGGYPLKRAVLSGYVPLVQLLLDSGADPSVKHDDKETSAMELSVSLRSLEMFKILFYNNPLCYGDQSDPDGMRLRIEYLTTVLRKAFENKSFEIVRFLTEEQNVLPTMELLEWLSRSEQEDSQQRKKRRKVGA